MGFTGVTTKEPPEWKWIDGTIFSHNDLKNMASPYSREYSPQCGFLISLLPDKELPERADSTLAGKYTNFNCNEHSGYICKYGEMTTTAASITTADPATTAYPATTANPATTAAPRAADDLTTSSRSSYLLYIILLIIALLIIAVIVYFKYSSN